MKSFLLYAVLFACYLANVKADCVEANMQSMTSCVKIKTDARDAFCATKPEEYSKCICVYNTHIHNCYDYCPDEPTIQTAKLQLEADIKTQCAAAGLDPDAIPANVYNDIIENGNNSATTGTTGTTGADTNANTNTNAVGNNQNQANTSNAQTNAQNNVGKEDYNSSAQTNKLCFALLVANLLLATLLF